jgi:anti-sigma-K factor RskA
MADDLHDLTAAYALDALDERERAAYEEHLATCERCRAELGELQGVAAALAVAADGPAPPAELRGRIIDAARAERPNVVPLRPRWAVPSAVAAAVAACAAIGLGLWSVSLRNDLADAREAPTVAALAGANGVAAVSASGRATLSFASLEQPPAGKTYEAWVIEPGRAPQPAGLFRGRTLVLTRSVPKGATIAITVEPAGGSTAPTSDPFARARV